MTAHERLLERTTEPPSDIPVPRQMHSGNVVRIKPQDGSRIAQSGLLGFQTKTMKKQAQRKRARHHDDGDPALSAAVDVVALQSATSRNDMQENNRHRTSHLPSWAPHVHLIWRWSTKVPCLPPITPAWCSSRAVGACWLCFKAHVTRAHFE